MENAYEGNSLIVVLSRTVDLWHKQKGNIHLNMFRELLSSVEKAKLEEMHLVKGGTHSIYKF